MAAREAYLFYQAGQAVAAAHLGLRIRWISANPALAATDIQLPRKNPKPRMILWLTGLAAENRAMGKSDPLRRTRNRARLRAQLEETAEHLPGTHHKRMADARNLLNQAQDRANAICAGLYEAIAEIVERLRVSDMLAGDDVVAIVQRAKARRAAAGEPNIDQAALPAKETLRESLVTEVPQAQPKGPGRGAVM